MRQFKRLHHVGLLWAFFQQPLHLGVAHLAEILKPLSDCHEEFRSGKTENIVSFFLKPRTRFAQIQRALQ